MAIVLNAFVNAVCTAGKFPVEESALIQFERGGHELTSE
jgi:hypothetical protein